MQTILTYEQIINRALALDAARAQELTNGNQIAICTTAIFDRVMIDGAEVALEYDLNHRYRAIYIRVSTQMQADDGFSAREQIETATRECIKARKAFRIFNDAALSGSAAPNIPHMMTRLRDQKAERVKTTFERVVLEHHADRFTAEQLTAMRRYIDREVITIKKDKSNLVNFDTKGRRLKTLKRVDYRPALTAMLADLTNISCVTVTDLSRLTRSEYLLRELVEEFKAHNTKVVGIYEDLQWLDIGKNDIAPVFIALLGYMAQHKLDDVLIGGWRGILTRLFTGKHFGRVPFWIIENGPGEYVLDAEKVKQIRMIVDRFLKGNDGSADTFNMVARYLTANGGPAPRDEERKDKTRTGRGWAVTSIKGMLRNTNLLGMHNVFGVDFPMFPPVITEAEWRRINEQLKIVTEVHHKRTANSTWNPEGWMLSGLIKCTCGAQVSHSQTVQGKYRSYRCTVEASKKDRSICHFVMRLEPLEAWFNTLMRGNHRVIVQKFRESSEGRILAAQIAELEAQRSVIQIEMPAKEAAARKDAVMQLPDNIRSENMILALMKEILAPLVDRLDEINAALKRLDAQLNTQMPLADLLTLEERASRWDTLDNHERNTLLRSIFKRAEVVGKAPNETLVLVLNTPAEQRLDPIPILMRPNKRRGWHARTLLSVDEWMVL